MTEYTKITAEEAVTATDVECFQAGKWAAVDRVIVDKGSACIVFTGGGSSVAPLHFWTLRKPIVNTEV